jgi:hypothetical protein
MYKYLAYATILLPITYISYMHYTSLYTVHPSSIQYSPYRQCSSYFYEE